MDMKLGSTVRSFSPPITRMIRMDHSHVVALSHRFTRDTSPQRKKAIASAICLALEIHAQMEEEIFYPALRDVDPGNDVLNKSKTEHDEMRRLIEELRRLEPGSVIYDDTFHRLMRTVMHHVADEENELLPRAEELLGARLRDLGASMTKRRLQLAGPHVGEMAVDHARAMPAATMLVVGGIALATLLLVFGLRQQRLEM